jgi:hypothetical protein
MADIKEQNKNFQDRTAFSVKALEEQLESDESEFNKLRFSVKSTIRNEIERFQQSNSSTEAEFLRLNALAEINQKLIALLVDDCMLNQLLLEQDIEDRKQLGVFGAKQNQDILGTNQGAINNNFTRNKRECSRSRSNSGSRLWNLANQD